jgi:hypothetical protein
MKKASNPVESAPPRPAQETPEGLTLHQHCVLAALAGLAANPNWTFGSAEIAQKALDYGNATYQLLKA